MQITLVVQFFALLMAIFLYNARTPKDRADIWRKVQCYAAARADGIELYSQRHNQYKHEMGVN